MSLFRLFQPHTQEYMFMWNSFVALHTFDQLSDGKRQEVLEHYHRILALNQVDPLHDMALADPDPFWLSVTLADLGIAPLLGAKTAKWFYIVDPRGARYRMASHPEELYSRVMRDIESKYGVSEKIFGALELKKGGLDDNTAEENDSMSQYNLGLS